MVPDFDYHELCKIFPLIPSDLDAIQRDIRENGQRHPITLFEGKILDGRNRYKACIALHRTPVTVEFLGDYEAARKFVISENLTRRHLDESQRAMVAAALETLKHGRPGKDANWHVSRDEAATMLNVAPRTVARAKKVRDKGTPELVAKVEAGEIAVSTAAKIAELPVDTQREIVAHVRPDTAVKKVARALKEVALATKTITASTRGVDPVFGVVYADPPWRFEVRSENGLDRSADNHYPTMSLDEIRSLKVPAAADAVLFLWATVPMLPEALDVMTAWGFSYKSHIAWVKDRTGTGYWARNRHELLLIGTKGEIPAPALGDQPASVIEAPLGKHSAKPACFAELIERLFPMTPKVELFCRLPREGWVALGNEADAA